MENCTKCKDTGLKSLITLWSANYDCETCEFCDCERGDEKRLIWLNLPETKAGYARMQKIKIDKAIKDSGIPAKFLERTLDGVPSEIQDKLQSVIGTDLGLYLYGPTGTGKTHAICAVARMAINVLIPVIIVNFGEAMSKVREQFSDESQDKKFFDRLKTIDVLILDDLGTEKHTEWIEQQLFSLVNYRYERNLPIYITSNISLGDLPYNPRIISRIYEITTQISFEKQKNFRLKK